MLNLKQSIVMTGESVIDGVTAAGYRAEINSTTPEDMTLSNWVQDKAMYKANRNECSTDKLAFEDAAYALQDKLIAEKAASETTTE